MKIEDILKQSWENVQKISGQLLEDAAELMDQETLDDVRYSHLLASCRYQELQTKRYLKK